MEYNKRKFIIPLLLACMSIVSPQQSLQARPSGMANPVQADAKSKTERVVGVVKDSQGEPLIGVSVLLKGTTVGTSTDVDGNFILSAPADGTLVFTYMGYKTKEMAVGNNMIVVMESDAIEIDEVVAVGYGSQRKISTIGAQSGVKFVEDLKQPVATLSSVLAGRVAGVIGMQRSGEAGNDDNTQIWIRGVSTTTNTTPLVLVDGVERSYTNIDPEDIESFQVLKDASATAVYGVKGANGVILIETKKGVKGKPKIKVEYNAGITSFTKIPELADGVTYMQLANEASLNKLNGQPIYTQDAIRKTYTQEDPMLYPNVNWMNEIFKKYGYNQRANISANGGSEFAQYYVSLGYYNENGLYKERSDEKYNGSMNFNRVNFVSNLTMQVTKTTEVELGVKGEISDYNTPYYNAQDVFKMIMKAYPTLMPVSYDNYRTPYIDNGGEVYNPYAMVYRMGSNKRNTSETRADLRVKQNLDFLLKGLSARALVAYDFYMRNDIQRTGNNPITYKATGRDDNGELILQRTDDMKGTDEWGYNKQQWGHRQYYFEAALDYNQTFAQRHRVSGLLLFNLTDYSNVTAGTLMHSIPYRNLGLAGRATYSYDDRYFFEGNFGYNGAENFTPKKRYGFFPSFGLAWVPSNEEFFKSLTDYISLLKFRFSWGQAGNSMLDTTNKGESNERFVYLSTVASANGFTFGDQRQNSYSGLAVGRMGVDVTWETSTKTNLGMDVYLWNNALNISVDLFKEHRNNIFLQRQGIPDYIGITTLPYGNLGIVENRGFEVAADLTKTWGPVDVMFHGTFSYNHNKIIEDDTPNKPYPWLNSRGSSLNTLFGYICDGFYTDEDIANPDVAKLRGVNVQAGDLKYRDLNLDGIIDAYDKTYIGNPTVPQIVYGFGATISYKNFTLGAFFQGVGQVDLSLSTSAMKPFADASAKGNLYANIVDRWTPENPSQSAKWPRLDYGLASNPENYTESTFWLHSGAYLRLKTLDLSYNIPARFVKKLGLSNMRVYLQGYNLLTFTKFDMWDVELGACDGTQYPNTKSLNIGFNFSF